MLTKFSWICCFSENKRRLLQTEETETGIGYSHESTTHGEGGEKRGEEGGGQGREDGRKEGREEGRGD